MICRGCNLTFATALAIGLTLGCGSDSLAAASLFVPAVDSAQSQGSDTLIRLQKREPGEIGHYFEVTGIPIDKLTGSGVEIPKDFDWSVAFAVSVARSNSDRPVDLPPMSGEYSFEGGSLRFMPQFPIEKGIRYRAVFTPDRLPASPESKSLSRESAQGTGKQVSAEFLVPAPPSVPTAFVKAVYPSADILPENQLKFYLHFSDPMSRGLGYQHIHLYNESGKEVDLPFLEIDEELWDRDGVRLTLFFDPGRIKRGVRPHEEVGPSLRVGERYTLLINADWKDAKGNPLIREFRKTFSVGRPDYESPDPKVWSLKLPTANTRESFVVSFREPLDHALVHRLIWIDDSRGEGLSGIIEVAENERQWSFVPDEKWTKGPYNLVVDTVLEDLAGNSVARPFEVDVFPPVQRQIEPKTFLRSFQVSGSESR